MVTGAFFCDAANVSDQKLNVLGGVWDWTTASPSGHVRFTLILLYQAETGDDTTDVATTCDIRGPQGEDLGHMQYRGNLPNEGEAGFLIVGPATFQAAGFGRHVFIVNGESPRALSVALDIRPPA